MRQAVLLAGGLGTRLGALAAETPKPVLDVGGRPFLAWILLQLERFGITEVVILSGHLAMRTEQLVRAAVADLPRPLALTFSAEPEPLGTAGALRHAAPHLADSFLLCNGDSLFDANLARLLAACATDPPDVLARLLLRAVPDAARYGVVETEGEQVTAFRDRPDAPGPGTINAGVYALGRGILDHLPERGSLERDVLPKLAAAGAVRATGASGWFIDIGIPADLARARSEIGSRLTRPALFLDRDGVLNQDHGHVGTRERFEWIPGARQAVAAATDAGWHVFVVTNQSGVARGLYTEADVTALMEWIGDACRTAGGTIDDWRHCPFHPEGSVDAFRRVSDWRKPSPGMILDLLRAWRLDPGRCVLVGDQPSDIAAATAAGVAGHLFSGGDLAAFVGPLLTQATERMPALGA